MTFPSMTVVSLQYLGSQTSDKVKDKIKDLLYSWKLGLPNETKITEAYEMLKKQGWQNYNELHVNTVQFCAYTCYI